MFGHPLYKLSLKLTATIMAVVALCRFSNGYGIIAVAAVGAFYALRGDCGISLFSYALFPFLLLLNPLILPKTPSSFMVSRITTVVLACCLILGGAKRKGGEQLPLGYIFFYLVIAVISSFGGYFPLISYFKVINFTAFFLGLYVGTKNIDQKPEDLFFVRGAFLAFALLLVWGSIAAIPFPSIAYFTSVSSVIISEGVEAAEEVLASREGAGLFCGITSQSQFLGPCLACLGGWVACDMLFVERKMGWLHLAVLAPIPIMIAMTKSRIGLLTFCMLVAILMFFCVPRIQLSESERRKISGLLQAFSILFVAIAIFAEVRHGTVSRLIRKTDEVAEDSRTLIEAFTSSRQAKIAECLYDFNQNPLWGMGFQVSSDHPRLYQQGKISLFSAPIEKSILPLMVLGETGVFGALAFAFFLFMFYHDATMRGYTATMTLFSVLLVSNMAEGTFFSPGGAGGVFWMFTVGGGFLIDMSVKVANQKSVPIGEAPLNPHRRTRVRIAGRD